MGNRRACVRLWNKSLRYADIALVADSRWAALSRRNANDRAVGDTALDNDLSVRLQVSVPLGRGSSREQLHQPSWGSVLSGYRTQRAGQ
jgi:hypothetical protein